MWVVGLMMVVAGVTGCKSGGKDATQPEAPQSGKGAAGSQKSGVTAPTPLPGVGQPFDFYLLNLSWSPEFCVTHPGGAECKQHRGFIVHGLWPQRSGGTYPENCGSRPGPTNPAAWADIMPDVSLVEHEWQTHGTCTPYDADTYFGMIRKAYEAVKVPTVYIEGAKEISMTPAAILAGFSQVNSGLTPGTTAMSCGNNRLTAIEVCLTKDLQPMACSGVRSCKANVVKITPVQ
jgi:ribonuclease T2